MGKYCEQCETCGDETITHGWSPNKCPFCELDQTKKQRDTLADALSFVVSCGYDGPLPEYARNKAKQALAAVKGEKL
jgi:hypothetical protein